MLAHVFRPIFAIAASAEVENFPLVRPRTRPSVDHRDRGEGRDAARRGSRPFPRLEIESVHERVLVVAAVVSVPMLAAVTTFSCRVFNSNSNISDLNLYFSMLIFKLKCKLGVK